MKYKILAVIILFTFKTVYSQELNATVKINSLQVATNVTIFNTLEKSLNEFINRTKWTNLNFKTREKIDCTFFFDISSYSNDQFEGTLQVSSTRPVYNSTYSTPIFNYNDKNLAFRYIEYEPLAFNPNSFDSNLMSIVAFYANLIIGLDGDSFALNGGTDALTNAQNICNIAQQGGFKGWSNNESSNQNRFFMINDLLSNTFATIREINFNYNFKGLDKMADDAMSSKETIKNAILDIDKIHVLRPNSFMVRLFFDAKSDEIQSIFSGGPKTDITALVSKIGTYSPSNTQKWATIKY